MHKQEVKYYDLKKNWPRVKRHLQDKELNDILVRDFNKYTYGTWRKKFTHGQYPGEFGCNDWRQGRKGSGRPPAYWRYTKEMACHWLVNFNLKLAMLVMSNEPWRIITSDKHSTVWNGGDLIFEFNYQAFGVPASECFENAFDEELPVGVYRKCYMPEYWKRKRERESITPPNVSTATASEIAVSDELEDNENSVIIEFEGDRKNCNCLWCEMSKAIVRDRKIRKGNNANVLDVVAKRIFSDDPAGVLKIALELVVACETDMGNRANNAVLTELPENIRLLHHISLSDREKENLGATAN